MDELRKASGIVLRAWLDDGPGNLSFCIKPQSNGDFLYGMLADLDGDQLGGVKECPLADLGRIWVFLLFHDVSPVVF